MPENYLSDVKILAPLVSLPWSGGDIEVAPGYSVKRLANGPSTEAKATLLNQAQDYFELNLDGAPYWLCVEADRVDGLSQGEAINIFLLALWLVVPTKTHVRFSLGDAPRIVYSNFNFIHGHVRGAVTAEQFHEAGRYIDPLLQIRRQKQRLMGSLHLTLSGCMQSSWQPAFLCFLAAFEGLLTYDNSPRLQASRLASVFSWLTETDAIKQREARKRVAHLYSIRSDIIHGRGYTHTDDLSEGPSNTENLAEARDVLRSTWRAILSRPDLIPVLEREDAERRSLFLTLEPPRPDKFVP